MIFLRLLLSLFILIVLSACSKVEVQESAAIKQQSYSQNIVTAAALSAPGHYALLADGSEVCLYNNSLNKKALPCITGQDAEFVELLGISNNEQYFYTSNRMQVRLYALNNGQLVNQWHAGQHIINDIAINNDGQTLLLGLRNGQAGIIKARQDSWTPPHHGYDVVSLF